MKGEVDQSRRTALRSVSARAKKRFPVRVQRRKVTVNLVVQILDFSSIKTKTTKPISFVSVAQPVVLHWGTNASMNL